MKILIFSWRDINHPKAGGSELYFHELSKRWIKSGNKVTWIVGGWNNCKKNENIDGIRIIRAGNELSLYFLAPLEYLKLKNKPDVIIDVENGIPFFTPIFSRKKKFLHIHHIHRDVWFKESEGKGIKDKIIALLGYLIENKIMPLVYKNIRVITLSKSSTQEIISLGFKKYKPEIVNPGIEFYKYKKIAKSKVPSILFLNRIKKYKGVKILLDAINEINNKFGKFNVWIAGTGDELEKMKAYSKGKHLENVKFLGKISEENKKELMQKAWIFINPSFKEGWGIVNIESNYFGTPVIGSNVSGIKDSVIDRETGLLFRYGNSRELADKIVYLIKNPKLRKKMEREAKLHASNFNWDIKAKEYLEILEK